MDAAGRVADAGLLAEVLFAVGIVALGLLAVPVLAASSGYAVSEVAGWPEGLNLKLRQAHGFYGVIGVGTVIGFDETHLPNHLNIVIYTVSLVTGRDLGAQLGDEVRFEMGEYPTDILP